MSQTQPTRGVAIEVYKRRRTETSSDEDEPDPKDKKPTGTRVKLTQKLPRDSLTPKLMDIRPRLACQRKLYAGAPVNVALRGMIRRLKEIYELEIHPGDKQRAYVARNVGYMLSRMTVNLARSSLDTFRSNCSKIKGGGHFVTSCGEFLESMERGDDPPDCERLQAAAGDPKVKALGILRNISGVGLVTAELLYDNFGCSTIADVRRIDAKSPRPEGWPITAFSRKGVANYEDWLVRIPRSEVAQVWEIVRAQAALADPTAEGLVAGSYRRGQSSCGDIDVLWKTAKRPFISLLVKRLHDVGFLVDDLTDPRDYAFALLYFTGDAHFGTSMRKWAGWLGWSLSDKGLIPVKRDHEYTKTYRGASVVCSAEDDIFNALGLKYVSPTDRGCK